MIDRVHFENFKSLKDVTLELGRLTVLVGPNACGKSSVLQGIERLSTIGGPRLGQPNSVFWWSSDGRRAAQRLASPGRPTKLKLSMREHGGDELALEVVVPEPTQEDPGKYDCQFSVSVEGPAGSLCIQVPDESNWGDQLGSFEANVRVMQFASTAYLHLDASKMVKTSVSGQERPEMASDGSELASTLAWMKGAAEEVLDEVTRDLKKVVPGVSRIRTRRERVVVRNMQKIDVDGQPVWRPFNEERLGDRFEVEFDDGFSVPADLLSEGTVLALGLLTKLHEPERPRLLLLDDIDRGLHIEAQAKLVEVLRALMKADTTLQILCTTHSPYLLDRFDPSEVCVLALNEHRHTRTRRLTDHPEFDQWKFGTQTGELWAALGSAWAATSEERP